MKSSDISHIYIKLPLAPQTLILTPQWLNIVPLWLNIVSQWLKDRGDPAVQWVSTLGFQAGGSQFEPHCTAGSFSFIFCHNLP